MISNQFTAIKQLMRGESWVVLRAKINWPMVTDGWHSSLLGAITVLDMQQHSALGPMQEFLDEVSATLDSRHEHEAD